MYIVNGKGNGEYKAEVNHENRLLVASVSEPKIAHVSHYDGNTFTFATNIQQLADVDQWQLVGILKNIDPLLNMRVWNLTIGWNGGNSTKMTTCDFKWVIGLYPTANYIQYTPVNMNFYSRKIPNVEAYVWDGVGSGMSYTGSSLGNEQILSIGRNILQLDGIPIIGFNNSVGVLVRSSEIGKYSVTSQFYMQEIEGD